MMSPSLRSPSFHSSLLRRCIQLQHHASSSSPTSITIRHKHQVRVILTRDLPEGQMRGIYAGEVHNVAAGYARNYLIPKKMAVYATPRNFERCGLIDPDIAAREEEAEAKKSDGDEDEENVDLKAADILRKYLRNKSVKLIRNVDPNVPTMCHPGHVSAKNIRDKLSKQLKIDLEDHETIHIRNEPIVGIEEMDEKEVMQIIMGMDGMTTEEKDNKEGEDGDSTKEKSSASAEATADETKDCDTKVKQLGDYLAKITLAGGYIVPLHFRIERR